VIDEVIKFGNGNVMVFDEKGEQMPQYQGRYDAVKAKILAHAPGSVWAASLDPVERKEW